MNEISKKRPTSITVIGWTFIVSAILMILSGGMGLMMFSLMNQMKADVPPITEELPDQFRAPAIIFEYYVLISLFEIAGAIFVLIAGIQFLKLRKWARNALEIISWLSLVFTVVFGIYWVISWVSLSSKIPIQEGVSGVPPMLGVFGAVMGGVVTLIWAAPLVVIIYFLRGKTIKEAVS